MEIVVFEDAFVSQLNPITLSRPAYSIQIGGMNLAEGLLRRVASDGGTADGARLVGVVRDYLRSWQQAEMPQLSSQLSNESSQSAVPRLFVNARLVPSISNLESLSQLLSRRAPLVVRDGESIVAAVVSGVLPKTPTQQSVQALLRSPELRSVSEVDIPLGLLRYPSDLIDQHMKTFGETLEDRLSTGVYEETQDGLFVAPQAKIARWVDVDTSQGPIVVENGAEVRPFSCLRGPILLGPMSRVNEQSVVKSGVHLGTMSKIGGEVEASVIEAFTNKQHHGYLGHSYLGRWVNLGAGTSNSNLKNTYGSIRIEVQQERIDTGLQFMGCVIGDYSKTAINTAIFTGKQIGCGSMVYGFVTTDVPSFVNYARSFGEVTEQSAEVVAATQRRVFLRRGIVQQPWHVELLRQMYRIASVGRELDDKPVSL